jgi:hypothetical protein
VRLNRYGDPTERGRFRCEVRNDAGDMVTVYVNIGEWFVSLELCTVVSDIYILLSVSRGHNTSYTFNHSASYDYYQ